MTVLDDLHAAILAIASGSSTRTDIADALEYVRDDGLFKKGTPAEGDLFTYDSSDDLLEPLTGVEGDIIQRGSTKWETLTGAVTGDILVRGASKWGLIGYPIVDLQSFSSGATISGTGSTLASNPVSDLTFTHTVPSGETHTIVYTCFFNFSHGAGSTVSNRFRVFRDASVGVGQQTDILSSVNNTGGQISAYSITTLQNRTAGTYDYGLHWGSASGTHYMGRRDAFMITFRRI
jgi:hypothetical protein